ncbi:MAG TPA: nitroreductase family protein [Bordetella sp.]
MTAANSRSAEHPISDVFLKRWSPRAFTGEEISAETLATILEAARWAPSAYNFQPWRFIYARKGTAHWERLLGVLNPFNQSWAQSASALIIVLSKKAEIPPGKDAEAPNRCHSFDAGAAWGYMALQAAMLGWQTHGMAGIEHDKIRAELGVPDGYEIEAGVALGRQGDKSTLPEGLQAREVPSGRRALGEITAEGKFAF